MINTSDLIFRDFSGENYILIALSDIEDKSFKVFILNKSLRVITATGWSLELIKDRLKIYKCQ